jgi:outer membrane protein assembly factor BamD (BamD/ComL family)
MKKTYTNKADQDIPVLKREQLGKGVRGKYFQQYTQQSNVVILKPEIMKAFPTSDAVNKALASMLAFSEHDDVDSV